MAFGGPGAGALAGCENFLLVTGDGRARDPQERHVICSQTSEEWGWEAKIKMDVTQGVVKGSFPSKCSSEVA